METQQNVSSVNDKNDNKNFFNAKVRCDSCTARAMVRVKLSTGILEFCGHHYTKYKNALEKQGAEVVINELDDSHNDDDKSSSNVQKESMKS